MKLLKRIFNNGFSTSKQRTEASELLTEIANLTNLKEAIYYESQLLPYAKKHGYNKYLMLLEEVKRQIENGLRERNEPKTIVATARIKVLT